MTTPVTFEGIDQAIEQARPTIERLADELWQLAELSLQEVKSARLIMDILREEGFTITSTGTARVPTAFLAEWGSARPILGVLVEYAALPGLGNAAVPQREARKDQVTSGHGCGHNLLGSAAIGASIALKRLMAEYHLAGTLRVYGCAAERGDRRGQGLHGARGSLQ
jgi:aminobenzoyl-glutamate utilization protein B